MSKMADVVYNDQAPERGNQGTEKATEISGSSTARLMITKIVNENFKSYAGTQELGPFHKNFSSIVGPNGSGKSNVIDAMLFVFGYRSKMIRTKKVSQLIHNSENHQNVQSCTVAVHFQKIIDMPGDDYEVIEGSQFVVSRTARKDNSSDYHVNGRKVPFKEVARLLKDCGIDLDHNRFLILQGEVEQISMMKPKAQSEHEEGMLEYLEDIIGSSRFKEPIEQLANEVERLNEARGEKLNRVKAVEKEKDELEGSKNEALEYLNMENSITKQRNVLFQRYIYECILNEEKAIEKRDEIKQGFDELKKELDAFTDKKKAQIKEYEKATKKYEELFKVAEDTKKNFSAYDRDDLKLREEYKHAKQNQKKMQKNLEKEKKKLEEFKSIPDGNAKELQQLQKKKDDLELKRKLEEEKLAEVMAGLKSETEGLQTEKEAKETKLLDLNKIVNEAKSKMDVARSELEIYKNQYETAMDQVKEATDNLNNAVETRSQRKGEIQSLQDEIAELRERLKIAEADLAKAITGEKKASDELRSIRTKVEEARSSLQASHSRGQVLEALMQQKASGKIPGILGRLGDLGAIDDKYDVAISTACGALDNIVCDSIDTAQKCITFLKHNNIGSGTFLGLDKVEKWRKDASNKIKTPQNVPRLYDLVQVKNDQIRTAFFFALRNTLVADDLKQATNIAFQGSNRWRVVTLQGEIIDQSGTMSGGGNKVVKGRMGSSIVSDVNPNQLKAMEKTLEKETKAAEEYREAKKRLEEIVDELKKELSTAEHQLQKNNMEIKALDDQEENLRQQIVHLKNKVVESTPDETRLKVLEDSVTTHEKEWRTAVSSSSRIETEVQKLHKQIMEIGGSKLKMQQDRVDVLTNAVDEVVGQMTKANVAIKTCHRNTRKAEGTVESLEREIGENSANIQKLEEDFKTLEEKATKVLEDYEKAQEEMLAMEESLEFLKKEVAVVEQEETKMKSKEVDIKHEVEKYESVLKENQQKVKHWQKELSRLTLVSASVIAEAEADEGLPTLSRGELEGIDKETVMYEITVLEEKLKQMKPNIAAIAEYRKKEEAYLDRVKDLDEVTVQRDHKRKEHDAMRKQRLDEFMAGFSVITTKLKEMYQMITLGGDAELELVDSLDPFSEGIVFSVRPPKKSWKNISNLSGGEKTLSSLALVFALHHYKPTPLYVMDEIDAALDFRNVSIVANYIKERTKNAQFIIISLRNNMFELADRLIGIFKTDNCTKSVAINPQLIASEA
ncbi:structural maintenance of chromosomes protein 4-like [Pocillopora damicornis]|uniref:structural maintenance of chromosomes protein 4-like n=1 Tax=Pocillopora damicornis TaxID=46731 RepID=UPI000F55741C|nr:structural maintenance of chromosomes protein 4-like [Pocillopora damicornis]